MSDSNKYHMSKAEKDSWDQNILDLANHEADDTQHVPSCPVSGVDMYLGNDLQWHQKPSVSIII